MPKPPPGDVSSVAWYHTIELSPGVTTPGYYDCRPAVARVPWPDVRGKRCLDVGTFDGFWAFEMERRGADEVVALDLDDPRRLDWPLDARRRGPATVLANRSARGPGFSIAHDALGSSVKRLDLSVYDLEPERTGRFDVVFMGAILLHLRDPIRALEAVRDVTAGSLLLAEAIDPWLQLAFPRRAGARLEGMGLDAQWWVPNAAGLARMLRSAGFRVTRRTRPFVVPFGASPWTPASDVRRRAWNLLLARDPSDGALQVALEARPGAG